MQPEVGCCEHLLGTLNNIYGLCFRGERVQTIIYINIALNKSLNFTSKVALFLLGCPPKAIDGDSEGWAVVKEMNSNPVVNGVTLKVIIAIPQESEIVSVIFPHHKTVEHVLKVSGDSHWFLPKSHENPK